MALKYGVVTPTPNQYLITSASPIDPRSLVDTFADLIDYNGWKAPGAAGNNAGNVFTYFGMQTTVAKASTYNDVEYAAGVYQFLNNTGDDSLSPISEAAITNPANWVRISVAAETLESELAEKQNSTISVSGITATTVEGALAEVSTRLAGTVTGGNLEALGNRVTVVESDIDIVSGKADANAEAISAITTETIPAVEADIDYVSSVVVENSADIADIQTALESIYTKDETDSAITSAIANAATLEFVVYNGTLAELLQTTGDPKKIYLVTNSGNANNAKDEYIYSEGKWELIGTTATDLTNYFTKEETQSAIDTTVKGVSAGLQSGVEANAAAIKGINETTIPAVEADVDYVSGVVDTNTGLIAGLRTDVNAVSGAVDDNARKLIEVDNVVLENSNWIGQVETRVSDTEANVDYVSGVIDTNAGLIAGLRTDVNIVSTSVDVFNDRVDNLEAEHDNINSLITANASAIAGLERTDTLKANSDATNINVDSWKTKLDINTLEGSVGDNAEAIEAVVADVKYVSGVVDTNTIEIAKKAAQTDFITLSGKVDANAAAIATKASQTDFITLSGKVDANAAAIATKAAQSDLEVVAGKVNANVGAISALQGAVANVYTKGETDDLVNAVAADVQIVSAELDGVAADLDNFIITVEEDYVAKTQIVTAVDALEAASDEQIPSEKAVRTAINEAVSGVKADLGSALTYKGSVADFASLPESAAIGDTYNVEAANDNIPAGTNYAWNGTSWDALGGTVDLSAYVVKTDVDYVSSQVDVVAVSASQNAEDIATVSEEVQAVATDVEAVSVNLEAVAAGTSDKIAKAGWKAKLGFIESTEVSSYQAQVDWNATSGVTSIANKPNVEQYGKWTCVNGKYINNIIVTPDPFYVDIQSIIGYASYKCKLIISSYTDIIEYNIIGNQDMGITQVIKEIICGDDDDVTVEFTTHTITCSGIYGNMYMEIIKTYTV